MILSFDKFERYELPQVTLCNPNSRAIEVDGKITITDTVGVLSNPKGTNLKLNFNAPHELSFDYYRHKGADPIGMPTEYIVEILNQSNQFIKQVDTFLSYDEAEQCVADFDLSTLNDGEYLNIIKQSFYDSIYEAIQADRYVYLTDIGYFIISSVTDSDEDNIDKKSISLKSCEENEFASAEGLYLAEGIYSLHTNDNKGLLDLFLPKTAGWTIGFIDPALLIKYDSETGEEKAVERYVEKTEVDNGYNFLYTTIQDMFECIVEPNIILRTVSVYSREYYAEHHLTDIHIAKYNLLKHKTVEENDEDKYTALNVQGKDENLEIRAVNPTGKNVIYNFEPRYSWMSSALQEAVKKWQEKCESVEEEYFNLQKSYYDELDLLFNEEKDIEVKKGELKQLEDTRDAALIMAAGDERDTSVKNCNDAIAIKQTEINTATSNYNSHKSTVQATYEEPINKINTDCTLSTIIDNIAMERGAITASDGQPKVWNKRIRTTNYIRLNAGTYTLSNEPNFPTILYIYDNDNNYLKDLSITTWSSAPITFTLETQCKIKFVIRNNDADKKIAVSDVSGIKLEKSGGSFAVDVNGNTIFTVDLLNELMAHIKPTDYVDEYMLVTESMTYPERFEKAKELMDRAQSQLVKISSGQKTYSIDTRSFLFNKQFRHFSEQLCAGAIIYVETKTDKMKQLHLTGIDINFDEKSTNFTLGNKYDRSDLKALYEDALGKNSKSFTELKYVVNIIEDQKKQIDKYKTWMDDVFKLNASHVLTTEYQNIIIGDTGYWGRQVQFDDETQEPLTDKNGNILYSPEQLKIINNGVYITSDNWNSVKAAIGKIYVGTDDDGEDKYFYGVGAETILGKMIVGNNLTIEAYDNNDKTTTVIDKNGVSIYSGSLKIYSNDYGDANNEILGTDSSGNLFLKGYIYASGGTIADWRITSPSIRNAFYDETNDITRDIFIQATDKATNSAFAVRKTSGDHSSDPSSYSSSKWDYVFKVTNEGKLTATDANIKGHIEATSGSFNGTVTADDGYIGGWGISSHIIWNNIYQDGTNYSTALRSGTEAMAMVVMYKEGEKTSQVPSKNNGWNYKFYVSKQGKLYAKEADITGNITADEGKIGGFTISDGTLKGSKLTISPGTGGSGDVITINNGKGSWDVNGRISTLHIWEDSAGGVLDGTWTLDSGSKITSDLTKKNSISVIDNRYDVLYDNLTPCTFKYNDGVSGRYHTGFIAQEVHDAVIKADLTTQDFAAVCYDVNEQGERVDWAIRYSEIVALNTWQIQKLKEKVAKLTNKVLNLETQIQTLTAG